jgi:diguanylate cyclase (GGDEF)-like protein
MSERIPDSRHAPPGNDEEHKAKSASRRLLECLDVVANAALAVQTQDPGEDTAARVIDVTMRAIGELVDFHVFGIAWFDKSGLDWTLARCWPAAREDELLAEISHQIDKEFVGWAVTQNKPIIAPATIAGKRVLISAIGTQKQVLGFFLGVSNEMFVPDAYQKLISIVLIYCANVLESEELYTENLNRKKSEARLEKLSQEDGLTGLANRRHFDTVLDEEVNRAQRSGAPLSLLMVDVDFFKEYNDSFGHQQGDAALRMVAEELIRGTRRAVDFTGRYGGEEFTAILPATDEDGARRVAEKIRLGIEGLKLAQSELSGQDYLTVSVGLATALSGDICTADALIDAADRALYRAKHVGKNQVQVELIRRPA